MLLFQNKLFLVLKTGNFLELRLARLQQKNPMAYLVLKIGSVTSKIGLSSRNMHYINTFVSFRDIVIYLSILMKRSYLHFT